MDRRAQQLTLLKVDMTRTGWTNQNDAEHGEVFTRRWVVELILDLVGYTSDKDLSVETIVEPSCGSGAFVLPIVDRLLASMDVHGREFSDLTTSIAGFDLLAHNVELTRKTAEARLLEHGATPGQAKCLAVTWIVQNDFLLADFESGSADYVAGNPPYIRLEDVPSDVSAAYRAKWTTMRGRSDIFVGFYERGLAMLRPEGQLGFICADRWMRNQYGAELRKHISDNYAVDSVIVMHDVDAFEEDVSAYPAITILRNGKQNATNVVDATEAFGQLAAVEASNWIRGTRTKTPKSKSYVAGRLPNWFEGPGLWPAGSPTQLKLIAELERRFALLEDSQTGTRVGIGVATGCDEIYLRTDAIDVEPDRLLPMLTASDIASGVPKWSGTQMINPWSDDGLVDLSSFPKLRRYLTDNEERVNGRYIAKRNPNAWFRTIDRVTPGLQQRPKLLLPDMKAKAHPVLDPGGFYPHHNLYYVVSDVWDLEVLGGLLLSDFANLFVGAYCVKMRGGTYRFQAQYLRKIRVPDPDSIDQKLAKELGRAFRSRDGRAATTAAEAAYGFRLTA